MKKKIATWIICFLMLFVILPINVHADMGPKPSVRITFENMGEEVCYGTLLSQKKSTGPSSAWDGNPDHIYNHNLDIDIWQAFADYEDGDGYYFLQEGWLVSESKELNWTYYPPSNFKILLYYPEQDIYTVSDIYERYAFDSYFKVTMNGLEMREVDDRAYDYTWELISFACRVVLTIGLEVGIAWLFGFRKKRLLTIVLGVNLVTQIGLNIALNIINYNSGAYMFVFAYVFLEILVFAIETALYKRLFRKRGARKISSKRIVAYALTANIVSFIGGMAIAHWVPGIF